MSDEDLQMPIEDKVTAVLGPDSKFTTEIRSGEHRMLSDEPVEAGGEERGPTPYDYLAAGLGACTAMTMKMYAERKGWDLKEVKVHLNYDADYAEDCAHCEEENRRIGRFQRVLEISGNLDKKQMDRLLDIANKCPVHKTLSRGVNISTSIQAQKT